VRELTVRIWALTVIFLVTALAIAVFLSPFASKFPDGLDWTAEKLGFAHKSEGAEIIKSAPMPDYAVPHVKNESISTSLSGLIGTTIAFALAVIVGILLRFKSGEQRGRNT